jgi:hypothetical protein
MAESTLRAQLIEAVQGLSDEQTAVILQVIRLLQPAGEPPTYDPDADTLRNGLFAGPPDLASRAEEWLWEEAGRKGAWTQKDDS